MTCRRLGLDLQDKVLLDGTRPIVHGGSLVYETTLQELLIVISRAVEDLTASSLCLSIHITRRPRRLVVTIDHIRDITRHIKEVIGQSTYILRWDNLVHTDVEILGLLKRRRVILRGWSSSWNHRAAHAHAMAVSLGKWMLLHWLTQHELPSSSTLVRAMVTSVILLHPFWGLFLEPALLSLLGSFILVEAIKVFIILFEVLFGWHSSSVSPRLTLVDDATVQYL